MGNIPELIVMLTKNDMTVANAVQVFEEAKDAPAKFWGFKEVGIPKDEMKHLVRRMKECKKTTFLEVVEYTEEKCIEGARIGAECGFDVLMGTLYFDSVKKIADEAGMQYYPFIGKVHDRPSILEGSIEEMIEEGKALIKEKGIEGFVKHIPAKVCLAGSVASFERLDEIRATGAWAFTIGSAFFDKKFGDTSFKEQIETVLAYMKGQE